MRAVDPWWLAMNPHGLQQQVAYTTPASSFGHVIQAATRWEFCHVIGLWHFAGPFPRREAFEYRDGTRLSVTVGSPVAYWESIWQEHAGKTGVRGPIEFARLLEYVAGSVAEALSLTW